MKAKVTHIEDSGQSNIIRVHHERPGEKEGTVERGFQTHSRFSAHIPAVGDEIELDSEAAAEETEEAAAE